MQPDITQHLFQSFLAINALLSEEVRHVRRALEAREAKHNPNWRLQPRAPKGVAEGGRWIESEAWPRRQAPLPITSGDPMDGADFAMFGEVLLFEFTRGRYSRALEATQDPQERMRIADDRAMLARQTFGNFSHEEVEKIYAEEMRTRRGRIALGSTDLSERALRLRSRSHTGAGEGRNVAVFEYRDANGDLQYIERVSANGVHAEELAIRELERLRIPRGNVIRIYTDRQPCSENCRRRIRRYASARVTWAVDWPDDPGGRTIANNALERQIRRHFQMESQDTLPLHLPRYADPAGNDARRRRRRRSGR